MLRNLFLLAVLSLGISCERSGHSALRLAEHIGQERPDSALQLLRGVNFERLSASERAHAQLLCCEALNRTEGLRSDSLALQVLRYYERHGSDAARARAWAYYAAAHEHTGDLEEAVKGYTQAIAYARCCRDAKSVRLLGALYHTLGILCIEQDYHADAEENFDRALAAARESGDRELAVYSRFMLASARYGDGRFREAVETLEPLVAVRDTLPFRFFAQQVTLQNLLCHTFAGDWTSGQLLRERARIDTAEIFSAPLSHGAAASRGEARFLYDAASALIFHRAGRPDSARIHIGRALARIPHFGRGHIGVHTIAAEIEYAGGDAEKAYRHLLEYISLRDSVDEAQRNVLVAELERRFRTAHETALREAEWRFRIRLAVLLCLLLAFAAAAVVTGYRRRLRRREEQLNETLALLDTYRASHDSLVSRLDASDEREVAVKRLLEGRFAQIREIAATRYTWGEGERLTEKVRELALNADVLAEVVRMADLYNGRAVSCLREQLPGWTARNYDFAALVVAGFSPQEICVMLDMTLNGVYTLKSKLKRRIARSDARDREFFLGFFL